MSRQPVRYFKLPVIVFKKAATFEYIVFMSVYKFAYLNFHRFKFWSSDFSGSHIVFRARLFESRLNPNPRLNHLNPRLNFNRGLVLLFKRRLALTLG